MPHSTFVSAIVAGVALSLSVGAAPAVATTHVVDQVGFTFIPANITISQGDTVEWHWSVNSHTVTEGTPCTASGGFDSPLTAANPIVSVTFNTPGTVPYFCRPHCGIGMTGTITVEPRIPTVSQWGLIVLAALILTAGAAMVWRRRVAAA